MVALEDWDEVMVHLHPHAMQRMKPGSFKCLVFNGSRGAGLNEFLTHSCHRKGYKRRSANG
jgi:hypothetical protein